ncbi:hypothetical protein ACTNDP_01665 [Paenibacillus barengoltzii]|uniref:hypothetical protein n=1 Tax=Paenibacillus barengoltzii TaxID=343517 RepID=UPI003F89DC14
MGKKWLGFLLAGALTVTGLPGWVPQAAAQPADLVVDVSTAETGAQFNAASNSSEALLQIADAPLSIAAAIDR